MTDDHGTPPHPPADQPPPPGWNPPPAQPPASQGWSPPAGSDLPPDWNHPPGTPPPPAYGGPAPGYAAPHTSGKAIAALVTAIAGGVLAPFCLCIPGPIGGVVGIFLGRSARKDIRNSGGAQTGEGMATAGEIIGWVVTVLGILGFVLFLVVFVAGGQVKNVFSNISVGVSPTP